MNEPIAAKPLRQQGLLFLQSPLKRQKCIPIPGTITHLHCQSWAAFPSLINLKYFHPQQSQPSVFLGYTDNISI
jgi:hypothetical protein